MKDYILKQFKMKTNPEGNNENIIEGNHYRFTLLNNHVSRMEFSKANQFENRSSQVVLNRYFPKVDYKVKETNETLEIITDVFHLYYVKEKEFTKDTLKIRLLENNHYYYYGQIDHQNLKGTSRTLDGVNGSMHLGEGLVSRNGYAIIDDSNSLVFNEDSWIEPRNQDHFDLYYFGYGHEYKNAIKFFQEMSGKTPLLPRFVFGNWWSRYNEYTEDSLKELIENFEKSEIPLSVCIIDMDWHLVDIPKKYGSGWTGYTWNKDFFPNPQRMIDYLKEKNLKVALNLHPSDGIRAHEECYHKVAEFMGVDANKEEPVEFDCADPKYMNAYFNLVHHPHEDTGIDFWWIDWQQGETSKMKGLDPLWILNHTHYLDLGRDNKRSLIFSRYAGLGSHRYPIGFSGDTVVTWESLDFQPYFTATASNINYGYWSHDIGGHWGGKEEKELYIRWVQFGVFSPIFRLHSTKNPFTRREPWNWDQMTHQIVSQLMQFRHELIPYIYSMSYRNHKEGLPLILPNYYEYDDHLAYEYKNQYLFGTEMYIAPITKPMHQKLNYSLQEIWLPKGSWYDFYNYQVYNGDKVYHLPYDIKHYPVFVKAGAFIPLSKDTGNTTDNPKNLEIKVFPGNSNTFTLYEDDASTNAYVENVSTMTKFDLTYDNQHMKLKITFDAQYESFIKDRSYSIQFVNINDDYQLNSNIQYEAIYENHQLYITFKKEVDTISFDLTHEENLEYQQEIDISRFIHQILFKAEIETYLKERIYNAILQSKDRHEMVTRLMSVKDKNNGDIIDFMIALVVNL